MKSKTWAVGGEMNLPIFQGGNLVGNLRLAEAVASAAEYSYQQTVLNAVQDAESSIKAYSEALATSRQRNEAVERNHNMTTITKETYAKGLANLPTYLTSQRALISAEESLLMSDTSALLELVSLYKALGGGWEAPD